MRGQVEWGLSVSWDLEAARHAIRGATSVAARGFDDRDQSPGLRYLHQRQVDALEADQLESVRARVAGELHDRLTGIGTASTIHSAETKRSSTRPTMLKASYLVPKTAETRFRAAIEDGLRAGSDLGMHGELTGPWPAYNFTALDTVSVGT